MISFDSFKSFDGVCSVPVVRGSFVLWYGDGSCSRVPASIDSLDSLSYYLRSWSRGSDFLVSVAFWCGGVCLGRCWGSWALSLRVCSFSDWLVPRLVVS